MKSQEVVSNAIQAVESQRWEEANKYLTDDFTFSGAVPKPVSKSEWLNMHKSLETGMPDFKFNLHELKEEGGNKLRGKVQITGAHTQEMPGPLPGVSRNKIAATGKKVRMPEEELEFELRGDKISHIHVKPTAGGGPQGLLHQLGIN